MTLCCKMRCWSFLSVVVHGIIWIKLFAARWKWGTIVFWRGTVFLLGFILLWIGKFWLKSAKILISITCGMAWVWLHPMGSLTSNSGRKSHLHGRVHICNFLLETASWSKLKCNKYPLKIMKILSTLVELIGKKSQLNPLTDSTDAWNQLEHHSPSYQWIIHILRVKKPTRN